MTVRTFPVRRTTNPLTGGSSYMYPAASRRAAASLPVSGISPFTVLSTAPEIRLEEVDQTDPAGRYRWGSTGDVFLIARSQAAAWANALGNASDFNFLQYDRANTWLLINPTESNAWYIRLLAGIPGTAQTNAQLTVGGSTAAETGVRVRTGDGVGSLVERIAFLIGAAITDIDINNAALDLNGNVLKGLATVGGQGTGNVNLKAYKAITDATAYRTVMYVLNPATDTEYAVAQAVPDAAVPKFTMAAPDDAPSTSELDADHITFGYTKATDTLNVYINEGGVIKTLAVGVLV